MTLKIIIVFLFCFFVALVLSPLIIKLTKKLKFGQTILHYVDFHNSKQGTPTMGGLIFVFAAAVSLIFANERFYSLAIISILTMLGFCIIGFLDDFIKIKYKQNLGLKPYQKIIGQLGVAISVALFVYFSQAISTSVIIPFSNIKVDLGWGIIPFVVVIFLAITNSVNLTDGLDGLAGGVGLAYLLPLGVLMMLYMPESGSAAFYEHQNLIVVCFGLAGSLLAYLCFNCYPAKIFMGDTGSLALGGIIGALTILSGLELYMPILGVMFVASAISVIVQVLHFKRTKKRVFLMAPLHHHYEKKGVHENRISLIYIVITLVVGLVTVGVKLYVG